MKIFHISGSSLEYVLKIYTRFCRIDIVDPELKNFLKGLILPLTTVFQKINGEAVAKLLKPIGKGNKQYIGWLRLSKKGHLISTTNPIKLRKTVMP